MGQMFQSKQAVNFFRIMSTISKATKFYINISTFVSPIYTFSLVRNVIVYTQIQDTNGEKHFIHIIYEGRMPTLAEN